MRSAFLAVAVACILMAGCKTQAKMDNAAFEAALAASTKAREALASGNLDVAQEEDSKMGMHVARLRRPSSKATYAPDGQPEGPVFQGRTAYAWEKEWKAGMHDALKAALPMLKQKTVDGSLDWSRVRAFIASHGDPSMDVAWQENVESVNAGAASRSQAGYLFSCNALGLERLCAPLQAALAGKMAKPFVPDTFLNDEGRKGAFGQVKATIAVRKSQEFVITGGKNGPEKTGFTIPTSVLVEFEVVTNQGHSSWDGPQRIVVDVAAPESVGQFSTGEAQQRQEDLLAARLAELVAKGSQQTLSP